ncbi:SRP40, C-terminal domain-containing protein [Hygrophoropsis aurantiaca]|uniref:SRP40, C-terminal domain-containing protein n=1 Tax=Hygrophoropsis aurantiaca TaxID=72124 RepID=A0ACB8AMQ6_9AGAM|nr:SRP40, C-terminal domain-containing protein [Hygrophoropsis aurantiaca]
MIVMTTQAPRTLIPGRNRPHVNRKQLLRQALLPPIRMTMKRSRKRLPKAKNYQRTVPVPHRLAQMKMIRRPRRRPPRGKKLLRTVSAHQSHRQMKRMARPLKTQRKITKDDTKTPKKTFKGKKAAKDSPSLSSESPSDEEDDKTTKDTKDSSDSSSSSDSSDEDDENPAAANSVTAPNREELQVIKKRRTTEDGSAVATAVLTTARDHQDTNIEVSVSSNGKGNGKPPRKTNERFSRIKPQNLPTEYMFDNGYEAKGGNTNDYGERAHRDLIVTRGQGFRKEKNKKKRGSYHGGEITMQTHSIKFDY